MSLRVAPDLVSPQPMPSSARALIVAMEARGLGDHGLNVAVLAAVVCRRLGLSPGPARTVTRAAFLHDIGMLAIPPGLLDHPGKLAPEEVDKLRAHPLVGERLLLRTPGLEGLAPLVRHSHERWDGNGYPDGLKRHRIPLGASIIGACDAWDAMRSYRVYRPMRSRDEAVTEMLAEENRQFDKAIVAALVTAVVRDQLP